MLRKLFIRNTSRIALSCLLALVALGGALSTPVSAHGTHDKHGTPVHVVDIAARDNGSDASFQGSFKLHNKVPTGLVEFRFTNQGSQPHMAQFFKLNEGVTEAQFLARLTPLFTTQDPAKIVAALHELLEISAAAGGADSITPGATQTVIERLTEGHYVVVCFDTTSNGTPHFLLGMHKSFFADEHVGGPVDRSVEVENGSPESNGTVVEFDHHITVPRVISSHRPLLLKVKVFDQSHEFQLIKVPAGTTAADLLACFTGQPSCNLTSQPIDSGGAAAIAPGSTHWVKLNLKPGTYAALCFVPDIVTGMPHAFMGMITVFTVRS